ncbi:MAG: 30S ribosomal protein S17 [Candidatus Omnitrophica bacterium]|jgi:small subunit ribosomal protein S17|nr:30S ribosomal protein S17 [Candidatus Omnitrophota bacterium]
MSNEKKARKQRVGVVISDKMDKTRVVRIERLTQHPLYRKRIKKFVNAKFHDEKNQAKEGDKVRIEETRPLSKDKRWRLVEIIEARKE